MEAYTNCVKNSKVNGFWQGWLQNRPTFPAIFQAMYSSGTGLLKKLKNNRRKLPSTITQTISKIALCQPVDRSSARRPTPTLYICVYVRVFVYKIHFFKTGINFPPSKLMIFHMESWEGLQLAWERSIWAWQWQRLRKTRCLDECQEVLFGHCVFCLSPFYVKESGCFSASHTLYCLL